MTFEFDITMLYEAVIFILILVVTYIIGRLAARILKGALEKAKIPEIETLTAVSILKYSIYFGGILVALGYIGIPVISFWIVLALAVAVLGIAAHSALDNIVSGYLIRMYGPFDVGDVIEIEGKTGIVKDLTLLETIVETPEHLVFSIPNSKLSKSEVVNFTKYKSEFPVELEFEIPQKADLEEIKKQIIDITRSYPKLNYDKPLQIYIQQITENGVKLKLLFFIPNVELKQGAKDFVASEILKKNRKGEIPLTNPNERITNSAQNSVHNREQTSSFGTEREENEKAETHAEQPKCPKCDSRNWHGLLHCRICGSYFVFGKCKNCDTLRIEKCPIDQENLEFTDLRETKTD